MKSNGWLLGGALVLCFATGAIAQEDPAVPPAGGAEAGSAELTAEPTPEAKPSWWKETFGDRNALYLEVGFAGGAFDDIDPSVQTDGNHMSQANLEIDSILGGRAVLGWKLPSERGRYVLAFEGFKEDSYEFEATGLFNQVLSAVGNQTTASLYPWWSVRSSDSGWIEGVRNPPVWTDDGDSKLEPGEVAAGAADLTFSGPTTDTLKNTTQTWDLLYQREWGGRRFRGAWSAGVRAFLYEGTVPMAAWLGLESIPPGSQYTDGTVIRLVPLAQQSKGWGPTGSGEAQYNFARGRVVVYLQARAALLLQNMEVDSGPFVTYARDPSLGTILAPARLEQSLDKSVWQLAGELGGRIRVLPGTHLLVSYAYRSYMDAVLLPVEIQIPKTDAQADNGTIGLYKAHDLKIASFHAGFSFQF